MKAAPAHFPYAHRTLAGTMDARMLGQYENCQTAFNSGHKNWRKAKAGKTFPGEQIRDETFAEPAVCDKEMADREGAANAYPGPDLKQPVNEVPG